MGAALRLLVTQSGHFDYVHAGSKLSPLFMQNPTNTPVWEVNCTFYQDRQGPYCNRTRPGANRHRFDGYLLADDLATC